MSIESHDPRKHSKSKDDYAQSVSSTDDDDKVLQQIGYVPSFRREFSNLATVRPEITRPSVFRGTKKLSMVNVRTDQLRIQYHGSLLQYRNDVQHPADVGWTCIGHLVLDSRRMHVFYPRYVLFTRPRPPNNPQPLIIALQIANHIHSRLKYS